MKSTKKGISPIGKKNPFYGKRHTLTWKKEERLRKQGRNNPMYEKKHRPSTIRKMRQAALLRYAK